MAETRNDASTESQERAVGISVFVSPNTPGFSCTIKHRYTDFVVNEILPNGQVLHLTNLAIASSDPKRKKAVDIANGNANGDSMRVHESDAKNEKPTLKRKTSDEDKPMPDDSVISPKKPRLAEETDPIHPIPADDTLPEDDEPTPGSVSASKAVRKGEIISAIPDADRDTLQNILGQAVADQVLDLYTNIIIHPDRKPRDHPFVKTGSFSEKAKRTEAHVAIRRIFSSQLETATMQDDSGVISIKAASTKGPTGARGRPPIDDNTGAIQKGKLAWSELGGEYLHFTLYKENKDTMEVLYYIASNLKVPAKNFQFAGTKDRRAVTVQRVAIFRVRAERMAELNRTARGWRVGNFEYKKHGLELGELDGNEFLLTLRDCYFKGEESLVHEQRLRLANLVLEKATESFQRNGFLNYYGLQRFGSFNTGTHTIGQKMLQGDLEGAVNAILAYPAELLVINEETSGAKKVPQDDIDRAEAIKLWQDGKTNDAVRKMPRRFQAESAMIQYLGKKNRKTGKLMQDRDWQGALMQITRNLRMMYVHAYQSFVWNTMAGMRWESFGSEVIQGDLVIVKDDDKSRKDEVDEDGEPVFHPAEDDSAPSAEDTFTRARPLSKDEAASGNFNIFDIVLPLPGYDVLYPANSIGRSYEEFMRSEAGGGIDPHKMRRSWKDISLSGAYRKLMARPGDGFGFEVKSYVHGEDQMVQTDLEKIQKSNGANANGDVEMQDRADPKYDQPPSLKDKKIATVLKLSLGSSQYATMALRELTKGGAVHFRPDYTSR